MSSFSLTLTPDSTYKGRYEMLSVAQLNTFIDSLERVTKIGYDYTKRTDLAAYMNFMRYLDTGWQKVKVPPVKAQSFYDILPDSAKRDVLESSAGQANLIKSNLDLAAAEYETRRTELRLYLIECTLNFRWLRRAGIFLIGAPLGSIVRKANWNSGCFAVIFFVIFSC